MVKYDMTLRQLNHDKPLYPFYDDHMSKEKSLSIELYDSKKLCNYKINDVLIMIKQKVELESMVELGMEYIEENIFVKGQHYSGDLLQAMALLGSSYWKQDLENFKRLKELILTYDERLDLIKYHFDIK